MATLVEIIKYQRSRGQGAGGALGTGIKERLKEQFDPRQIFSEKGLMVSMFPGLKAYKAKGMREEKKELIKPSIDVSGVKPVFLSIGINTTIASKNSIVLPAIHRDFNVMRQNIIKLVKLEDVKPATKADRFFIKAQERERIYESDIQRRKNDSSQNAPVKLERLSNSNPMATLMKAGALLIVGAGIVAALRKVEKEDLVNGLTNFVSIITGSTSAEAAIDRNPARIDDTTGATLEKLHMSEAEQILNTMRWKDLTPEQKNSFLTEQFKSEGAKPGTLAYDLNNPGAMVWKEWQSKYGGKPGRTVTGPDGQTRTFTQFPTIQKGREAQLALWESSAYSERPLGEALRRWVSPGNEAAEAEFSAYAQRSLNAINRTGPRPQSTVQAPSLGNPDVKIEAKPISNKVRPYGTIDKIENIIVHHTGGHGLRNTLDTLGSTRKSGVQYATQFVIDRDGTVYRITNDNALLYHTGATNRSDVSNANSVGMELIAKNSSDFTPQQVAAATNLAKQLQKKYGISSDRIFGHGEISSHKMASEGRGLAQTIRNQVQQAETEKTKNVSSLSKPSGENISLASAETMLAEEFATYSKVFVIDQSKFHTNTVIMSGQKVDNPVRDILRTQFG
jgi:N-acetyl-anhydromuramyl-L-alanine amidase AmpD